MQYDADWQPVPETWLALGEGERIDMVMDYHLHTGVELENARLHAVAHVMIENQLALADPPLVPTTLARLMDEGLDRHDAIHAVGSILIALVFDAVRGDTGGDEFVAQYNRELAVLTAAGWRAQAEE